MRIGSIVGLVIVGAGLLACTHPWWKLSENQTNKSASFSYYLAQAYENYATEQLKRGHLESAQYFKRKSEQSVKGELPLPDQIHTDPMQTVFQDGYKQLNAARTTILQKNHPEILAQLQVAYDCWLNEYKIADDGNKERECREDFYTGSDRLFEMAIEQGDKVNLAVATQPIFDMYFVPQDVVLNEQQKQTIKHLAKQLKQSASYDVTLNAVAGEEVIPENSLYEQRLSNVQDAFVEAGLNKEQVGMFILESEGDQSSNEDDKVEVVIDAVMH